MAKFKVKDFVTDGKEVTEIKNNSYIFSTQNGYCSVCDIDKVDANFHLYVQ